MRDSRVAGSSRGFQDPHKIPTTGTAAYSGLRWGELVALAIPQVDQAARVITVDRKVRCQRMPMPRLMRPVVLR
jgi:hypothetical protein